MVVFAEDGQITSVAYAEANPMLQGARAARIFLLAERVSLGYQKGAREIFTTRGSGISRRSLARTGDMMKLLQALTPIDGGAEAARAGHLGGSTTSCLRVGARKKFG